MTTEQGTLETAQQPVEELNIEAFEASLPPEVKASLDAAIDGLPDPVMPTESVTPTESVVPAESVTPTVQAPTDPPPPAPIAAPTAPDPRYQQLEQENYHYRQIARASQDEREIAKLMETERTRLVGEGWGETEATTAVETLGQVAAYDASFIRDRKILQDAAFMSGNNHNLTLEQIQDLANSRDANDFRGKLNNLIGNQPNLHPQVLAKFSTLEKENATIKAENEALKKQVVPNGQRFGEIAGAPVQGQPMDPVAMSARVLDGGQPPTDSELQAFDKYFEGL